jgi:hypothetical protein
MGEKRKTSTLLLHVFDTTTEEKGEKNCLKYEQFRNVVKVASPLHLHFFDNITTYTEKTASFYTRPMGVEHKDCRMKSDDDYGLRF